MSDPILPEVTVAFASSSLGKLNRTDKGRELVASDLAIVDRVKYDPDDPDRIWIGVRRSSFSPPKHRTLRCFIDDQTWAVLDSAITSKSVYTLAAFAQRLHDCFARGINQCPFITEESS